MDVELGVVESGERGVGSVLAEGAGSHGEPDLRVEFVADRGEAVGDGLANVGWDFGRGDELLQLRAEGEEGVGPVDLDALDEPVDLGSEVVVIEKAAVGRSGDDESRRHIETESIVNLSEVRHLRPDHRGVMATDHRQGHHERGVDGLRQRLDDGVQIAADRVKTLDERGVFAGCEGVEVLNHTVDPDRHRGCVGDHEVHAVWLGSRVCLLHHGHGFQGAAVGGEEYPEGVIAFPEQRGQPLGLLRREFGFRRARQAAKPRADGPEDLRHRLFQA